LLITSLFAASLVGACGKGEKASNPPDRVVAGQPAATPIAPPASVPVAPVEIKSDEAGLEFKYGWPAAAAASPALDGWLRAHAEALRADAQKAAAEDSKMAAKAGYPFRGHSYEETFAVAADTQAVLVLQSEGYVFTGGAHGMPIHTVIIWDKAAKKRRATSELIDIASFKHLANERFCDALDQEREKRRGAPVQPADPAGISSFTDCVDMTKQTLLPVSKRGNLLDTLRVVIEPYEAGPYAEGTYIVELPFDARLMGAVKPAWKGAFTTP
jgi:hypothetical protein